MATKRICDRCGAEINPMSSVTYVRIESFSRLLFAFTVGKRSNGKNKKED